MTECWRMLSWNIESFFFFFFFFENSEQRSAVNYICNKLNLFFFFSVYLESVFCSQLTLQQLIQPDLESQFIVRSQLGPSIQSGSSPSAGLEAVTQSTLLSKNCQPQLVSNPDLTSKVAGLQVHATTPRYTFWVTLK